MSSLEEFEKNLRAEQAERQDAESSREHRRDRKHRRHHRDDEHKSSRRRSRERTDGVSQGSDRHDGRRHRHENDHEHRHRRHRSRDRDADRKDDDAHRAKRSRHEREDDRVNLDKKPRDGSDDGDERSSKRQRSHDEPGYLSVPDPKQALPSPDQEKPLEKQGLVRDSWMTTPSAIDIDYVHRPNKDPQPKVKSEPQRIISKRELNNEILEKLNSGRTVDDDDVPKQRVVEYTFGDEGSQWRMTKLKAVYNLAEQSGRPVDEVAVDRFGSLQEFDDAREEKIELDRRNVYGAGFIGAEKPTGDLYRERIHDQKSGHQANTDQPELEQGVVLDESPQAAPLDQTALNRMRAQMMKAKLRRAPDAEKLEAEYNAAAAAFQSGVSTQQAVVLGAAHNRMLAGPRGEVKNVETTRGRERGQVQANEDMSIDDMVREERRTRGAAGGEGMRLAERIAKDGKFDNELEYMDENAEKLAKRVHKSEANLKNMAVSEYTKMNKVLDSCPLCHHEDRKPPQDLPIAPIISLATRTFLTLPTDPELTGAEGGAVIVPTTHHTNLLECDDDEWEEIRNFMKSLTRMYHDQGREVIFYENAAAPHRRLHAALTAVPIPYDLGDTAPAFFREAMLSTDEEWSQHKKIIDTGKRAREGLGKLAFRRSIAKQMPYFHVWFTLDGGLGHIVEDASRWPKGDLFAREIIGGMVDAEPDVIKRQGRWQRIDGRTDDFKKRWRRFDWTRVLAEGQ